MGGTTHDGIVDDDRVYTTTALARILGVKQERTIETWLTKLGCPVKRMGSRVFVSGYEFRLSIERYSGEPLCDEEN